ncbi:hypothetical protein HF638_17580 [Paenibacillus sp. SZ31]|uniref:hypothetical protein n=1 Tax=Paenibacillus sp. SZ31 TaxID=2725555 RepID=UPI00146F0165|nr:hypothetical protein [Paenibacillus sp. SZ31]NMI05790.1 hypothetical protein [Paenibacillus sp. SZ31]
MQILGNKGLVRQTLAGGSQLSSMPIVNTGLFTAGIQSVQTFSTITTTGEFNQQFHSIFNKLNISRQKNQQQVYDLLAMDSHVKNTLRKKGVALAWKYEQAEILMGGKGTTKWSPKQRQEILTAGKVHRAEGHHINNVAKHLENQANPDNIRFAKNKAAHKAMHGGDFRNQTTGEPIDRNKRLKQANYKRVAKNELYGIGMVATIGLGVGFTIGFTVKLAQSGLSIENVKVAAAAGAKMGVESTFLGVMNHLLVRGIGEAAKSALQGVAKNIGLMVTENLSRMCKMAVTGGMAITLFSVYQFCKLKLMGYGTKESLIRVGRSATYSLTILVLSIIAQGLWGGCAGTVVSVGIGFSVMVFKFGQARYTKDLVERLRIYTIQKYEPLM